MKLCKCDGLYEEVNWHLDIKLEWQIRNIIAVVKVLENAEIDVAWHLAVNYTGTQSFIALVSQNHWVLFLTNSFLIGSK